MVEGGEIVRDRQSWALSGRQRAALEQELVGRELETLDSSKILCIRID